MHEMSIARNIVEIVDDVIRDAPEARVDRVYISIGRLVGVVHDSLRFAFNAITSDTALAGAVLVIEEIPPRTHCNACGHDADVDSFAAECPRCGSRNVQFIAGNELLVREIEVLE
jgi:hydrogenase nickel incorporation protein HypA/HybF